MLRGCHLFFSQKGQGLSKLVSHIALKIPENFGNMSPGSGKTKSPPMEAQNPSKFNAHQLMIFPCPLIYIIN